MHSIHICIGGQDDSVVSQVVEVVFNPERVLEQIEFLVLVNNLFRKAETVERFSF